MGFFSFGAKKNQEQDNPEADVPLSKQGDKNRVENDELENVPAYARRSNRQESVGLDANFAKTNSQFSSPTANNNDSRDENEPPKEGSGKTLKKEWRWRLWSLAFALLMLLLLLYGVYRQFAQTNWLEVEQVTMNSGEWRHLKAEMVSWALQKQQWQNLATADLTALHQELSELPWVRQVRLKRIWPHALRIEITEHRAQARWNPGVGRESRLLSEEGVLFMASSDEPLPELYGFDGNAAVMAGVQQQFNALLQPYALRVQGLWLSNRNSWRVQFNNGLVLQLGQVARLTDLNQRLQRFLRYWPEVSKRIAAEKTVIDLRYPNGFSIRLER